jgi:hypothetical protein
MQRERVADEFRIPDVLWETISRSIHNRVYTHPFGGGKTPTATRICTKATLLVLRTVCGWKALNAPRFCPSSGAHDRIPVGLAVGGAHRLNMKLARQPWKASGWPGSPRVAPVQPQGR